MALKQAHCLLCGDPVLHNPKAVGRMSQQFGRPLTGWHHDDITAARRDHEAAPHDFRSPQDEGIRYNALMNRAHVAMSRKLDQQFLGMQVDDIFNDRRT